MNVAAWGAENFFRYESLEICPEDLGRLVLIDGKNYDFSTASSNAAGKSSVIEALTFALFGKTIRRLDGIDSIIRPGQKSCKVWAKIEIPEGELLIERYRKDKQHANSTRVLLNGEDVVRGRDENETKRKIEKLLGFDYDLFTRAVVIHSRMTESFSSLTDRYLKSITERLLGMPEFAKVQQTIKDRVTAIETRERESVEEIRIVEQTIQDTQEQIEKYKRLSAEHEKESESRVWEMGRKIVAAEKDLDRLKEHNKGYKKEIATVQAAITASEKSRSYKQTEIGKIEGKLQVAVASLAGLTASADLLKQARLKYQRLEKAKTCPECDQKVSTGHIDTKLAAIHNELKTVEESRAKVAKTVDD